MPPIYWRFFLKQYLLVFFYCIFTFIALLLTLRLGDIAHFITLGPEGYIIAKYVANQLPYILPIAIPISSLISTILLLQKLSSSNELTAFRASGFSLSELLAPILITSVFLSIGNFYLVSEVATESHLISNQLKSELRSINPLLLLNHKHLMRAKGYFFETLGQAKLGISANDVIFGIPDKSGGRIHLMVAKNLATEKDTFSIGGMTVIAGVGGEKGFDRLLVDNISNSVTSSQDFHQFIDKKIWHIADDYLRGPILISKILQDKLSLKNLTTKDDQNAVIQKTKSLNRSLSEMIRRISLSLSVFTFTLMGAGFGVNIGRRKSLKNVLFVTCLAAMYIIGYFTAKGFNHHLFLSSVLYLLPLLIITILSQLQLNNAAKGVE